MNMLSFESIKSFQEKWNCLESLKTTRVRKTTGVQKTTRVRKTTGVQKTTRPLRVWETRKSGSSQESKKAVRSQETRTSRVWKTGRSQESRIRRITPNNTAVFPPAHAYLGENVRSLQFVWVHTSPTLLMAFLEPFSGPLCDGASIVAIWERSRGHCYLLSTYQPISQLWPATGQTCCISAPPLYHNTLHVYIKCTYSVHIHVTWRGNGEN
jgi:hypothetical protein